MNEENIRKVWEIVVSGGPVMLALLLLAILLYWNVTSLFFFIHGLKVSTDLQSQTGQDARTRAAVIEFKEKLNNIVSSQLKYANVLIVAAPLLGLLGTVIGMLDTFKGIGADGGEDTTKAVADGVKVALITTQTGLSIAIFGIMMRTTIAWIHRRKNLELVDIELETMKKSIEA